MYLHLAEGKPQKRSMSSEDYSLRAKKVKFLVHNAYHTRMGIELYSAKTIAGLWVLVLASVLVLVS
jgi:hypothetical protein